MNTMDEVIKYLKKNQRKITSMTNQFGKQYYEEAVIAFLARETHQTKPSNKGRMGRRILKKAPSRPWLDHWAVDGDTLITEPYSICLEDLEEIVTFARANHLRVGMSGASYHYPGWTMRIVFKPGDAKK